MQTMVRKNAVIPISKEKIKEAIPIMDVARKFSPKISEKTKLPLIICPVHEDHNLGSCRVYPATNTFKCEACGAHGDMLKLASGYMVVPLSQMNDLLESLTNEFGLMRESVQTEKTAGSFKPTRPPERLSPEEYKELLMDDHYKVPVRFEELEFEEGEVDYVPVEYNHVYYRTLAVKDPAFHDWVICTVSRKYWLRFAEMEMFCQIQGYNFFVDVLQEKLKRGLELLKKGLIDKRLYRKELKLQNELLQETILTCPHCKSEEGKFFAAHPEMRDQWDYARNKTVDSESVPAYSNEKFYWMCPNGHSYQAAPEKLMRRKARCPVCCSFGFARPDLISEWHPTKNGDKTPFDYSANSKHIAWFKCSQCGTEYSGRIANQTIKKTTHC